MGTRSEEHYAFSNAIRTASDLFEVTAPQQHDVPIMQHYLGIKDDDAALALRIDECHRAVNALDKVQDSVKKLQWIDWSVNDGCVYEEDEVRKLAPLPHLVRPAANYSLLIIFISLN